MYPEDTSVRSVKFSPAHKNSVARSLSKFTALYGSCEQINTFSQKSRSSSYSRGQYSYQDHVTKDLHLHTGIIIEDNAAEHQTVEVPEGQIHPTKIKLLFQG